MGVAFEMNLDYSVFSPFDQLDLPELAAKNDASASRWTRISPILSRVLDFYVDPCMTSDISADFFDSNRQLRHPVQSFSLDLVR